MILILKLNMSSPNSRSFQMDNSYFDIKTRGHADTFVILTY